MTVTKVRSKWDSGNLVFQERVAGDGSSIIFGVDDTGLDVKWFGDTTGVYALWDESADSLLFVDNAKVVFGTGSDVTARWDGTDLDILAGADDLVIKFGNGTNSFDLWIYGNAAGDNIIFDASANTLDLDGIDLQLEDSDILSFGDGDDVSVRWDGTDLDVLAAADDSVIKFGTGTNSFDLWIYGNIATSYLEWDASADLLAARGPVRVQGFNSLSRRFELKWVAGQRGKPGINADIQNAAEATRMVADPDFEVLGVNGSSDDVTFNVEGGVKLETDGADGDEVILAPHLDANQTAWEQVTWGTDQEVHWECHIKTGAAINNSIIWAGLKLTSTEVTATDDNQVFFRYEDAVNAGNWQAISSVAGTDDAHDSGVTVAATTQYHLKIVVDSARIARFYLNGVLVETSGALTNTVDLKPYIGIATDGAVEAKHMLVYGQAISRIMG